MASDPARAPEAPSIPSFAQFLAEQRGGALLGDLTEQLAELVQACTEQGKGGSLTLTIKVKPTKSGPLEVSDDVRSKPPVHEPGTSYWFADGKGGLHRRDPNQPELPLRQVPPPRAAGAES